MTIYKLPDIKAFESCIHDKNTHLLTFTNRAGMQMAVTDFGARLVSALVPDKQGNLVDVVLGFNSIDGYTQAKEQYHGATIGRFANRIADGRFNIGDQTYTLAKNNGKNALHGGPAGFHNQVWDRQVSFKKKVDFYYVSKDGEEGFPGELNVNVSYELTNENEIKIRFLARTNKTTVVNLTNHAYFNLNGEGNGDVLSQFVQIPSSKFLPINPDQIPLGTLQPVDGTCLNFRKSKKIIEGLKETESQIQHAHGLDHGYVKEVSISSAAATAYSEETGIVLELFTDQPCIHFYTGNFLADDEGKSKQKYLRHGGFCFEAQHAADSPNQEKFPSVVLHPGEVFERNITYKFSLHK